MKVQYGEIWRESLGEKLFRYSVIVSPNSMNDSLEHVLVVPIVSRFKNWPTRIEINFRNSKKQLQGELIQSIPKNKLVSSVGNLSLIERAKLRHLFKTMLTH